MINLHLNGDIIRCPDIAEIKRRDAEVKDSHRICRYNVHEDTCGAWNSSLMNWQNVKKNNCAGRCMLSGSDICPGHQAQQLTGRKEKTFKIDNVTYRKATSAAHYLLKKSKFKTLFITLTFPKFKTQYNENMLNERFSKFMENIRTNYNCAGYVAVRERSSKHTHRYHYHLVCSIPYTHFIDLNNAWCSAISDICEYSRRALTTKKKAYFINNAGAAFRYICKYITKAKGQESKTRIVFISNNLVKNPVRFDNQNCEYYTINDLLADFKSVSQKQTSDYTTAFRINDSKEFEVFCERILYKFFNLPRSGLVDLYSFPIKPG
jgi:hypothetical protein